MTFRYKNELGIDDRWLMLLGIPLVSILVTFVFMEANLMDDPGLLLAKVLQSFVFTLIYWLILRRMFIVMRRIYPGTQQTNRRIAWQLLITVVVIVTVQALSYFMDWCLSGFGVEYEKPGLIQLNVISFILALMVGAVYEGIYFFSKYKAADIERERLKRANIRSELDTLRNQVNPHFLFNSLNTLSSIIPEDPDLAVEFVRKLSSAYRNILEIRNEKVIPLERELDTLHSYVFLLELRFRDKLRVEVNIDDAGEDYIIPLTLQILIENAVKHNIVSLSKPLTVNISFEKDHIVVRNNLQVKRQAERSTKVGLQNIRERYQLLTGREVLVTQSEEEFRVRLPRIVNIQTVTA